MSRLLAYARLIRLPNVFTACADVSVGLLAGGVFGLQSSLTLGTSACLYSAGMAWNDYFDRNVDARERPQRPIPSGAISPPAACGFACTLTLIALALATIAGLSSLLHAAVLLILILTYDCGVKATPIGPLVMGGCRVANILLGFATSDIPWSIRLACAAIIGTYVVGITLFARDEVGRSRRPRLLLATAICVIAASSVALVPAASSSLHPYVAVVAVLILLMRAQPAIATSQPRAVQQFVKTAIMLLVVLDAALATALAGPYGLIVLVWLLPAIVLGRRIYST